MKRKGRRELIVGRVALLFVEVIFERARNLIQKCVVKGHDQAI